MSKVLVVDDEPDIRTMARLLLEAHGWDVDEAGDGQEALDLFRANDYRAIVLDQRMPGMTGFEVAEVVREEGFLGPIIFFSAYVDDDLERRLVEEINHELTVVRKTDHRSFVAAVAGLPA